MSTVHTVRPRYAECDQQNVVFHGHWLTYFDEACTRFFEAAGFEPKQLFSEPDGFDMMVVGAELSWHGPAGFDDEVRIEVGCARIGTASFALRYTATVAERLVCEGTVSYVSVVAGGGRSSPIPDRVRAALEAHRAPEPAQR